MHFKNYPFSKLPFSPLFRTYTTDFEKLSAYYETNPFNKEAVKDSVVHFKFDRNRKKTVELLLQFNRQFGVDDAATANIKRLESENAVALVTGQQLGLFGGPVYTIFKILSTIHLSKQWEDRLKRPVIPVFWLADEDHDYDEVRSATVLNKKGIETFSLPKDTSDLPVSEIKFPEQVEKVKHQLKNTLVDTDFSADLWELIDSCFKSGQSFLKGFGMLISRLFSKHGLVLAGSNDVEIKKQTKACLIKSVQQADAVYEALNEQTNRFQNAYHQQVTLYSSHLFYLSENNGRTKLSRDGDLWNTDNGKQWTTRQLVDEIDNQPEKFSPDVFLRPALQDALLPAMGYIGGPGEVAYYGQMKAFYEVFERQMPVIFPRLSATFVEPAIDRIFRELPFQIHEYGNRIEDLESAYAKQSEQIGIEKLFRKWKEGIDDLSAFNTPKIKQIDKTLADTSKKMQAHYFNELDKLKGKAYRSVKERNKTQLKRIRRIKRHLFPAGNLQERTLCGIYYMNKFGLDIWDRLLQNLDDETSFRQHKLIYL